MNTQLANLEAERHYLEAAMCDKMVLDESPLVEDDFFSPAHRKLYKAITSIVEEGGTPDLTTVLMKVSGEEDAVSALKNLDPITSANSKYYARAVRDLSKKRTLHRMAVEVIEASKRLDVDPGEITEMAEKAFSSMYERHEGRSIELRDALHASLDLLQKRYEAHGEMTGIPTGFSFLDRDLDGLQDGALVVIGARPSIGKTAFAISMAIAAAAKGFSVGFFTAEMPTPQIMLRMLAAVSRLNLQSVRYGRLTSSDFGRLFDAGESLSRHRMLVDDTPNPTLTYIKSRARWMKRHGVQVIYIDYLTLINHGDARTPRYERVGEVSKALKGLARELGVPIVVLSQLNRTVEGERPTLDALRQSGEIEEDADVVVLLHREREATPETDAVPADVIVAKNRNGPTGAHGVVFLPKYATFEEKIE